MKIKCQKPLIDENYRKHGTYTSKDVLTPYYLQIYIHFQFSRYSLCTHDYVVFT